MTPKEKANELSVKFYAYDNFEPAKEFALVAAKEIVKTLSSTEVNVTKRAWDYWQKVIKEIEKL